MKTYPHPGPYHPDPDINAAVATEARENEVFNVQHGYPPRRWWCDCGASHARGHFPALGSHRCLACGYVGTGGTYGDAP